MTLYWTRPKCKPVDPEIITPGVRELVKRMREAGFDTCDSGDGVTNVKAGMEGALDVPHVHMVFDSFDVARTAAFDLKHCLNDWWGVGNADIQITWGIDDDKCMLSLYGVDDETLWIAGHALTEEKGGPSL